MKARTELLPDTEVVSLYGLFLITQDQMSVAPYVSEGLRRMGATPVTISTASLLDPEKLAAEINEARSVNGEVRGIIHLSALSPIPMPETLSEWRQYTQIDCKSLLTVLQICASDLTPPAPLPYEERGVSSAPLLLGGQGERFPYTQVLAASLLGGQFGRDGSCSSGLPTGGGSKGLLKTMVQEWSGVEAKAIDFDDSLSAAEIARTIIQELLGSGGHSEIGYPQGKRMVFQPVLAPLSSLPASSLPIHPAKDWVVLITGGARGITAEIASTFLIPGITLILVGRSPEPAEESPNTVGIEDVSQLRKILLAVQGKPVTPVQIENQLRGILRDRVIRRNLSHCRQAGVNVEYQAVDVRNAEEFGCFIEEIYSRYGRLDAVVHGAGVIEDKLIVDKTLESFDFVFDTKVDSAFILSRHLRPDSLKLLVFFTSVAGSFGNRGQSDYAAANEVVNRLAWQLDQRWQNTRIVALNWGPWDITGMASESVNRQFRERGVIPIPPDAGRHFFIEELRYGNKGDTELIIGTFEGLGAGKEGTGDWGLGTGHPITFSQLQIQPNSTVTLEHTFSLLLHPYLQDHCLDGKPVLPAAGALEWMAQFVQAAWSEWTVTEVRDLRVLRGIVLEEARKVLFIARASTHADLESLEVAAQIVDPESKIPFYRATVILRPQMLASPKVQIDALDSGNSLDVAVAYRDYLFHGPSFQLLTAIDRLNGQGIDAEVMPSQQSSWLFDLALIDTAPQLAIAWSRVQKGTTALPSRFGSVIRYGKSALNSVLKVAFRVTQADDHMLVYDAIFIDENGNVRFHLKDIESTCNTALNRLASKL